MTSQLKKFNHSKLSLYLNELELPESLVTEFIAMDNPLAIIQQLTSQQLLESAIKLLALGLPKREAIWWSYLSALDVEKNVTTLLHQTALKTIENWVYKPSENLRQSAGKLADKLEYATASAWAAAAVFCSGGSIAADNRFAVMPDAMMCGHAVSNAIIINSYQADEAESYLKKMLRRGLHIAMGGSGKI